MYIHFLFANGSNPYIAITHEKLFDMIRKYDLEQLDVDTFLVHGEVHFWTVKKRLSAYDKAKPPCEILLSTSSERQANLITVTGNWQDGKIFSSSTGKSMAFCASYRK